MFYSLALPKKQRHDDGVREPDLDTIDNGIADALDDGKQFMVMRVVDD